MSTDNDDNHMTLALKIIFKVVGRAWNLDLVGTYAQTELGHGTFIRGLELKVTTKKTDIIKVIVHLCVDTVSYSINILLKFCRLSITRTRQSLS